MIGCHQFSRFVHFFLGKEPQIMARDAVRYGDFRLAKNKYSKYVCILRRELYNSYYNVCVSLRDGWWLDYGISTYFSLKGMEFGCIDLDQRTNVEYVIS